jgi:hypothetical protein
MYKGENLMQVLNISDAKTFNLQNNGEQTYEFAKFGFGKKLVFEEIPYSWGSNFCFNLVLDAETISLLDGQETLKLNFTIQTVIT